uniref:Uncharacterized protein n=1 Tax=Chromera velia CCMP2878 TaxID=1169474 RepID=A0A0G4I9L4_9ALVE|eukprot:Cvel_2054.t1-p1 / transcript=Cvel_2054.t1 / gene=Cvel_2054 / organism=Chromera_velia_CCMP2878 / gene_product=hypothetical protein / transcript_product=hypothetical protein / location=Cvel_scaffold79:13493-31585(+) / protein_length=910 / sequence_SO=supercontig / SO=protein_coding / is_pseudo=false
MSSAASIAADGSVVEAFLLFVSPAGSLVLLLCHSSAGARTLSSSVAKGESEAPRTEALSRPFSCSFLPPAASFCSSAIPLLGPGHFLLPSQRSQGGAVPEICEYYAASNIFPEITQTSTCPSPPVLLRNDGFRMNPTKNSAEAGDHFDVYVGVSCQSFLSVRELRIDIGYRGRHNREEFARLVERTSTGFWVHPAETVPPNLALSDHTSGSSDPAPVDLHLRDSLSLHRIARSWETERQGGGGAKTGHSKRNNCSTSVERQGTGPATSYLSGDDKGAATDAERDGAVRLNTDPTDSHVCLSDSENGCFREDGEDGDGDPADVDDNECAEASDLALQEVVFRQPDAAPQASGHIHRGAGARFPSPSSEERRVHVNYRPSSAQTSPPDISCTHRWIIPKATPEDPTETAITSRPAGPAISTPSLLSLLDFQDRASKLRQEKEESRSQQNHPSEGGRVSKTNKHTNPGRRQNRKIPNAPLRPPCDAPLPFFPNMPVRPTARDPGISESEQAYSLPPNHSSFDLRCHLFPVPLKAGGVPAFIILSGPPSRVSTSSEEDERRACTRKSSEDRNQTDEPPAHFPADPASAMINGQAICLSVLQLSFDLRKTSQSGLSESTDDPASSHGTSRVFFDADNRQTCRERQTAEECVGKSEDEENELEPSDAVKGMDDMPLICPPDRAKRKKNSDKSHFYYRACIVRGVPSILFEQNDVRSILRSSLRSALFSLFPDDFPGGVKIHKWKGGSVCASIEFSSRGMYKRASGLMTGTFETVMSFVLQSCSPPPALCTISFESLPLSLSSDNYGKTYRCAHAEYAVQSGFQFQAPRSLFMSAFPTAIPEVRILKVHRLGQRELASRDWSCQLLLRTVLINEEMCRSMKGAGSSFWLSVQDTKGTAKSRVYKLRFELMARRCGLL